jgi:Zn-finger nucleic acid-binding protein
MNCPRCNHSVLDERERNGVVVDVCPSCRGVWLDRGELEKMLAFTQREFEAERSRYGYEREPPSSDRRGFPPGSGPGPGPSRHAEPHRSHGHYKKKSWLENLGDIFD